MRQIDGTEALARVHQMRGASTEAERLLWSELRARRLDGFKFRRQVWIGAYIADLLCVEARLIVELDGSQHGAAAGYDARRDAIMAGSAYRTLRFWNNNVTDNMDGVLAAIRAALIERMPSPSHAAHGPLPLPSGEG